MLEDDRNFIAAALDFSNAGPERFNPGYDQYRDLVLAAHRLASSPPAQQAGVEDALALVRRIAARESWQSHYGKRWEDEAAEIVAKLDAALRPSTDAAATEVAQLRAVLNRLLEDDKNYHGFLNGEQEEMIREALACSTDAAAQPTDAGVGE